MKITKIVTLSSTDINQIRNIIKPTLKNRFVRGQSKSSYSLSSSFFRTTSLFKQQQSVYKQNKLDWIFCRDYFSKYEWDVNSENPLMTTFPTGIGKNGENLAMFPQLIGMAIQQHDGKLCTPLLDVSYDIEMPLYCACKNHWDTDGKLFVISINYDNSYGLNDFETEPLYIQDIVTTNNRLKKQKGMFLKTMSWVRDDNISYNNPGLAFGDISLSFNAEIEEYIIPKNNKEIILYNLSKYIKPEISLYHYFGSL